MGVLDLEIVCSTQRCHRNACTPANACQQMAPINHPPDYARRKGKATKPTRITGNVFQPSDKLALHVIETGPTPRGNWAHP
jgi:hypothetical protein